MIQAAHKPKIVFKGTVIKAIITVNLTASRKELLLITSKKGSKPLLNAL